MDMEYGYYLEQRYIHSTAMVIARLLTSEDAAALHYEDGFRGIGGDIFRFFQHFRINDVGGIEINPAFRILQAHGDGVIDAVPPQKIRNLLISGHGQGRSLYGVDMEHILNGFLERRFYSY